MIVCMLGSNVTARILDPGSGGVTHPVQPTQPPVDPSTQAGYSTPLQVMPPFLESGTSEPQVGARSDQGILDPQSLTHVLKPYT